MASIGKLILIMGILLVIFGLILQFADRIPFIGRLPGDIHVQRKNYNVYFPITTCILLSLILTLLFHLFRKR